MQSLSYLFSYHLLLSVCPWIWSYLRLSYLIVSFYLFDFILPYLISSIHLSIYFMTRLNSIVTKLMVVYLVLSCFTWCYVCVIFYIILFSLYISISDQVSLFKPFYLRELWFILYRLILVHFILFPFLLWHIDLCFIFSCVIVPWKNCRMCSCCIL